MLKPLEAVIVEIQKGSSLCPEEINQGVYLSTDSSPKLIVEDDSALYSEDTLFQRAA